MLRVPEAKVGTSTHDGRTSPPDRLATPWTVRVPESTSPAVWMPAGKEGETEKVLAPRIVCAEDKSMYPFATADWTMEPAGKDTEPTTATPPLREANPATASVDESVMPANVWAALYTFEVLSIPAIWFRRSCPPHGGFEKAIVEEDILGGRGYVL